MKEILPEFYPILTNLTSFINKKKDNYKELIFIIIVVYMFIKTKGFFLCLFLCFNLKKSTQGLL